MLGVIDRRFCADSGAVSDGNGKAVVWYSVGIHKHLSFSVFQVRYIEFSAVIAAGLRLFHQVLFSYCCLFDSTSTSACCGCISELFSGSLS